MSDMEKNLMNEVYESALITLGAVIVSMISKKALGKKLGGPDNINGTLKLAAAVSLGTTVVKYAQDKKWLPADPFKK